MDNTAGQAPSMRLPLVPGRTTPGIVFSMIGRTLNDCLAARHFGRKEMREVLDFFQMSEPECVFCGSPDIRRWDHLVAIKRGGETVLGNIVPACARCDDSKRDLPYEEWMRASAQGSPTSRGVADVEERIERIRAYTEHFGYKVRPLEERLDEVERTRLTRIQSQLAELRQEVDALIHDYRERTGTA